MSTAVSLQARRTGKTLHAATMKLHEQNVDRAMLIALHSLGGEADFLRLWDALPISKRDLYRSAARQYALGNVKRHHAGEPIALTAAARFAIEAGLRAAQLAVAA